MQSKKTYGIYFAIITALISGVAIFLNKFAVDAIKPPLVFTAVKNSGVGLFIISALLISGKWKLVKKLNGLEIMYLALIGIIGGAAAFYLYFTGLSKIPSINAAIIHKTLVIWVAILAVPFLKEKLSPLQIGAVVLLFASNFVIGGFTMFEFSIGELFVLAATILWGIETILAKKVLSSVDPDIVTGARMGFGSVYLLGAAYLTAPSAIANIVNLTSVQWMWMAVTSISLLIYVMSWYRALKLAPAVTVTAVLVASTVVTNILSAVFVTHKWTEAMGMQAVLMFVAVGIFWYAAKKESKTFAVKKENLAPAESSS